jgi:hypothetical protein
MQVQDSPAVISCPWQDALALCGYSSSSHWQLFKVKGKRHKNKIKLIEQKKLFMFKPEHLKCEGSVCNP